MTNQVWWVVFYHAKRKHKLPRRWEPITHNKQPMQTPYTTWRVARNRAVRHNNISADMHPIALNDARAMIYYGDQRPATITEWSIYD